MFRSTVGPGGDAESLEIENEKSEVPSSRRERSPSVMSHSSGVLEWDPSADVGAMGASNLCEAKTDPEQKNELSTLQRQISEVKVLYVAPTYDLEGGQSSRCNSASSSSQKSRACAYSTPSGSPVPLQSLQYSPVAPESSSRDNSNGNNLKKPTGSRDRSRKGTPSAIVSSDDNNKNDDLTEGRRTPGRVVSGASTDWEYDNEKQLPSKSMSQWQTSGMTRSEIEYQNRKNSASSTSVASSVFVLQVDAGISNKDLETPVDRAGGRKQRREASPPKCDHTELEKKIQKAIGRRHASVKHFQPENESSDSDPSSMCVIVDDFVKLLESNPAKENIKYDVLKNHRDYHLMKVWKQMMKLEKLNMNLLAYKQRNATEKSSRRSNNIIGGTSKREMQDIINFYTERAPAMLEAKRKLEKEAASGTNVLSTKECQQRPVKPRPIDYSSEPLPPSKNVVRTESRVRVNEEREYNGRSCPVLKNHGDQLNMDKVPIKSKSSRSRADEELAYALMSGDSRFFKSKETTPRSRGKPAESSTEPSSAPDEHYDVVAQSSRHNCPILHEIIAKFVEKELYDRKRTDMSKEMRREVPGIEDYRPGNSRKMYKNESSGSSTEQSSRSKYYPPKPPSPPPLPPRTKSPVGFYVPMDSGVNSENEIEEEPENDVGTGTHDKYQRRGRKCSENDTNAPIAIQEYFIKNNPHCYKNMKERDDFLINIKRDRQVYNETVLRDMLQSDLSKTEVAKYLESYIERANPEEKRRLKKYWELYLAAQDYKKNVQVDHVIPLREMKERTARLRKTDTIALERQKKEAEERRRKASRTLQRDFSSNLRRFQKMGTVNVPDRMKLGTR